MFLACFFTGATLVGCVQTDEALLSWSAGGYTEALVNGTIYRCETARFHISGNPKFECYLSDRLFRDGYE